MNVEIAKITSSLESLKQHSDQIQQEISTSQERDTDIENIELELEKMKVDLKDAEINLSKVQEEKDYVDVLRDESNISSSINRFVLVLFFILAISRQVNNKARSILIFSPSLKLL